MTELTEAEKLHQAVDRLTRPRHHKIERWQGGHDWVTVAPLWQLLEQADSSRSGKDRGTQGSRPPADLEVIELRATIRDIIVDALAGHDLKPHTTGVTRQQREAAAHQRQAELTYRLPAGYPPTTTPAPLTVDVPASIRQLATTIATVGDEDLTAWWRYRVDSWCRQITHALHLTDDPQPRRIRDTACPTCQATHVTVTTDGESERVPALLIDFAGAYIRAAECSACGASWFRGAALAELADTLNNTNGHRTPLDTADAV